MKEKIVIFDWGGVIESHENGSKELQDAKINLIKKYSPAMKEEDILKNWSYQLENGLWISETSNWLAIKKWLQNLEEKMNISVPLEEFISSYIETFQNISYYPDIVEYACSIKEKCKIGLLSNLSMLDYERLTKQVDLTRFDKVYLSFELGCRKPNKEIYEYVMQDLKCDAGDILFIDDDTTNIAMAKKYGWNTCQAYGYELEKIKTKVQAFLENNKKSKLFNKKKVYSDILLTTH